MSLVSTISNPVKSLSIVRSNDQCLMQQKNFRSSPICFKPLHLQSQPFQRKICITYSYKGNRGSVICASALNATCGAEQTQTVTRQSSTITVAPIQGKEKSPELDDGGTGLPPRDDGDGGGGGGGGGGKFSGGFFFFGLLAFLGFLKDQESEGPYREDKRRKK